MYYFKHLASPQEFISQLTINNYNYTLMCLTKGTDIDTHTSIKNGAVIVLKGRGMFKLYDKDIEMKQGVFIFMPKDAPHSLKAEEDLAILLCLIN